MNLADAKADLIDRLHTACLTVQCMPSDGPKGTYTLWPSYRHTWWDEGNENSKLSAADITRRLIQAPRFYATAKQIDACLPTLALLDGCDPNWRRIVSARAHQLWYDIPGGWRAIGADCGVAHKTARVHYLKAVSYAFDAWLEQAASVVHLRRADGGAGARALAA